MKTLLGMGMVLAMTSLATGADTGTNGPATFEFKLAEKALTSAGVYDDRGHLVRSLWSMKPYPAGRHAGAWDGQDEFGKLASAGMYEYRVVVNNSRYANVGAIGNTGTPPDQQGHMPGNLLSVAVGADGAIFTANGWEEAGADFKKWDRDGHSIYDAHFQIRNGDPNGAPYAIAVDDGHIYCTMGGWESKPWNAKQQLQRFRISDGKLERFTEVSDNAGHIQLYEWPAKQVPQGTPADEAELMKAPLRALAVRGDTLYVCDALAGKIHKFHKATGRSQGSFAVKLPTAIALDASGRVWVGHEHGQVTVFHADGQGAHAVLHDLGDIQALAFGPSGQLYVADSKLGEVRIYAVDTDRVTLVRRLGRKARLGDAAPDRFYMLRGVAVDSEGNIVTIQTEPRGGAHLARWSSAGKLLWEQLGLEFVSLGNYAQSRPDEFISLQFHRYELTGKQAGEWKYRGNLFAGDNRYTSDVHGVPRLLHLGEHDFFYTAQGDGMKVFRRDGTALTPAAMIGGNDPDVHGSKERTALGQWTWHDDNGNGIVDEAEVDWFKKPGDGKYAVFGMNVGSRGEVLYCDHQTRAIWEMPVARFDGHGNPIYNWSQARTIVAADTSSLKFFPLMAVRADDGTLYAFGRSDAWKQPRNQGAWMGGWALCRYDAQGRRLWEAKLPEVCVGMDAIPGGGVMLGWYEKAHIYHYTADGLLIGLMMPGKAAGQVSGWLDNTASLAVNRDPKDHLIDVFAEEDYLQRILWYRVDDRDIVTIRGKLKWEHRP